MIFFLIFFIKVKIKFWTPYPLSLTSYLSQFCKVCQASKDNKVRLVKMTNGRNAVRTELDLSNHLSTSGLDSAVVRLVTMAMSKYWA